jgi:hypothetical protein
MNLRDVAVASHDKTVITSHRVTVKCKAMLTVFRGSLQKSDIIFIHDSCNMHAQTTCESSNEWLLNSQPYDQSGNVLLLTLTVVKIVSVNVQR